MKQGNERFATHAMTHQNLDEAIRASTSVKQTPFAAIVCCSDSRVAPELVFDQGLGDLFVVRVAGNVVDGNGMGSLEYAVEHLHVKLIVVLGHAKCGAVSAALSSSGHPMASDSYIPALLKWIAPAVRKAGEQKGDPLGNAIVNNEQIGAWRIRHAKGALGKAIRRGELKVASGVYDLSSSRVRFD